MATAKRAVLIVDDEPDVREVFRDTLEFEGFIVAESANGKEALAYLRSHPEPCLVLLDLMMPVLNGYQFLEELRRDPALHKVSVFLVSAATREEITQTAKSYGAVGSLAKPVQIEALIAAVKTFC